MLTMFSVAGRIRLGIQLSNQSLPLCSLGECGIDRPSAIFLSVVTSITNPLSTRRSRQLSEAFEWERQVTYFGAPFSIARPFILQRSSAASREIKGGFRRNRKVGCLSAIKLGQQISQIAHFLDGMGH